VKRSKPLRRNKPFRRPTRVNTSFGTYKGSTNWPSLKEAKAAQLEHLERAAQELAFPKAERVEDPEYLAWLRRTRCQFCPWPGPCEAHHVILKGMGGATLRDDYAVSACPRCHRRCHATEKPAVDKEVQMFTARRQRAQFLLWKQTDPKVAF
jgi:hypothetical protein